MRGQSNQFMRLSTYKALEMFEEEYTRKLQELRAKQLVNDLLPSAPQGGGAAPKMPWGAREFPELPSGAITQKAADKMKPPTAKVWNNWKGRAWRGHLQALTKYEFPRISEPWDLHGVKRVRGGESLAAGKRMAAVTLLRRLWRQYCKWKSLKLSCCPVKNLFPEGATLKVDNDGKDEEEEESAEEEDEEEDEQEDQDLEMED